MSSRYIYIVDDDEAVHLENTCYAHWLATADPVAGMCVQRQLAFALAEYGENLRTKTPTKYAADTGQIRGILNMVSALWKSNDVATHVTSESGTVLWTPTRIGRMKADIFPYIDAAIAPAQSSDPWGGMRRISGSLTPVMQIGFFRLDDNSTVPVITQPNFEVVQYSKEALYLWARSGDPYALKWLTLAARHIAARVEIIGGSRGIDQCSPLKGRPDGLNNDAVDDGSGSRFPVGLASLVGTSGFKASDAPWTTMEGWATWVRGLCRSGAADRYDGAAIHTATQAEGLLLLAKAAGVSGLDSAIARMTSDKARTDPRALRYTSLNMAKHWAAPIETLAGK